VRNLGSYLFEVVYVIFSKSIFYIRNRAVKWFRPITAYVLVEKNRFIRCLATNSVYYLLWESLCLQFTSYVRSAFVVYFSHIYFFINQLFGRNHISFI
jgi:hypothetical protein